MTRTEEAKRKVLSGMELSREEAMELWEEPLEELCRAANEIRVFFCGNRFDLCTIINAKSGRCSENCKYCAQSAHYPTSCEEYPLLPAETICKTAQHHAEQGVGRYSLVTSGRSLDDGEVEAVCRAVRSIKEQVSIQVCGSFGLLAEEQYEKLMASGLSRIHNNLETSEKNFPNLCTTHSFQDKLASIRAAQRVGMSICSGGIFGIGESNEDRVDMALSLKRLGVHSVPMNLLNPVKGTPYEGLEVLTSEAFCRIIAIYRFLLPDSFLRLAGGRGLLSDQGRACFCAGANAAITGDMLTTAGISVEGDLAMLRELGFEVAAYDR